MSKREDKLRQDLAEFVRRYGRRGAVHGEPNDRQYDRKLAERIRHMDPAELDALLRDDDSAPGES